MDMETHAEFEIGSRSGSEQEVWLSEETWPWRRCMGSVNEGQGLGEPLQAWPPCTRCRVSWIGPELGSVAS